MRFGIYHVKDECMWKDISESIDEFASWASFLTLMKSKGMDWDIVLQVKCFLTPDRALIQMAFRGCGLHDPVWYRIKRGELADPYMWDLQDDAEAWVRGITADIERQLHYDGEGSL